MRYLQKLQDPPKFNGVWVSQHVLAVAVPVNLERPLIRMIEGWLDYADRHKLAYDSHIGDDHVLGPEWVKIGAALRELLNGDLGRLDGGTLDSILYDTLKDQGFDPDQM